MAEASAPVPSKSSRPVLRVLVAAGMVFYGCAKITGAQFHVLQSEMDRPLREVSGFWLTWYYFGHSLTYKYLIAACEICAGVLLCWRRTALMGAALASTLLVNVVVIDLVFGVDAGGTAAAVLLLGGSLVIMSDYRDNLVELFWRRMPDEDIGWLRRYRTPIVAGILIGGLGFQYWVARFNNQAPTPIDGTWDVIAPATGAPSTVYFERERAHMCVFVSAAGLHVPHDFEFVPTESSISIYERWLAPASARLYQGRLQVDGSIVLRSDQTGDSVTLRRRDAPR